MQILSVGVSIKRLALVAVALVGASGLILFQAQDSKGRALRNGWEVHRELAIAPAAQPAVKDHFQSFLEYQDMVMFHPKLGYYASGRVSFTNDYQTYPIVLAPLFGHMVAEQIFFMWDGMRKAGSLTEKDQFTIAEFGPGDGVLAESILDYLDQKSKEDPRWRDFANQVLYICYDRSPALNDIQRERNKRFGSRFAARVADATNFTAAIPPGSLKGIILSNELPDAFSVHKIILSPNGTAEVAFVVPSLPAKSWPTIRALLPAAVTKAIESDDVAVEKRFFNGKADPRINLTRSSLVALLENLLPLKEYETTANSLEFQETYVPASVIPELTAHLRRYASVYAKVLAKNPRGLVSYINLGADSFIQGAAQVLKTGYVFTIDYGTNWDGILADDSVHFRTYGPLRRETGRLAQQGDSTGVSEDQASSDPYVGPTLNDMTTDVNFSLLAAEGELVGLKPMFYGSQKALQTGTSVTLAGMPPGSKWPDKFYSWASDFSVPSVYKVFVQQKEGTDPAYQFPDKDPESLGQDAKEMTEAERSRAAEIEKRMKALP